MMRITNCNNDQNIISRFRAKMSENFSNETTTGKFAKAADAANCLEKKKTGDSKDELNLPYDHMYTTSAENGEIKLTDPNCQNADSEVKFWKEWLILHLDLIQQQSDEILSKDRTIVFLRQDNDMLRERLSCLERGAPFQPRKFFNSHSDSFLDETLDMTQDSNPCEDDKTCLDVVLDLNCENGETLKEKRCLSDEESQTENQTIDKFASQINFSSKNGDKILKTDSEIRDFNNASDKLDFSVQNSSKFDPMRNLRMSIRRKRLSNSSAVSNLDCSLEEKRQFRKFKKRRKRNVMKDTQILTTTNHYVTEANKTIARLANMSDVALDIPSDKNLEVPRWRIKLYASCYAMEGTENLDDEVFNKRHSRLENDERRRKRWDVQRIREQRLIEKLKQRQDRMGSGSRSDEHAGPMPSLWPNLDDIKFIEVSEQIPVSAFGCPVPKISASEFALPWLNNPSVAVTKKVPARKSTTRRKGTKR